MTVEYAKTSSKTLQQQIDVVAQFHAYKIRPDRIAYRTGIAIELVTGLIDGELHQRLFKAQLASHRKSRRDHSASRASRDRETQNQSRCAPLQQLLAKTLA